MTTTVDTICECGHPVSEHAGAKSLVENDGHVGFFGQCQHRDRGERFPCKCNAYAAARICSGCGGDGIAYDVSDRRRQLARLDVHLGSERGAVTDCPGVEPVANPFIDAIKRLEHLVSTCDYRLAHDIHTIIAASPRGDGRKARLEPRETPTTVPELVFAAWGIYPDEMCQFCYGTGRARSRYYPDLDRGVSKMDAELTVAKEISPVDSEVVAKREATSC
jgi:hypothetical protein